MVATALSPAQWTIIWNKIDQIYGADLLSNIESDGLVQRLRVEYQSIQLLRGYINDVLGGERNPRTDV